MKRKHGHVSTAVSLTAEVADKLWKPWSLKGGNLSRAIATRIIAGQKAQGWKQFLGLATRFPVTISLTHRAVQIAKREARRARLPVARVLGAMAHRGLQVLGYLGDER